jgi:ubiquinone/menaquinone biosynthesis C-methylase UbiE
MSHRHGHEDHPHHHEAHGAIEDLADLLDLDAEVMSEHLNAVRTNIERLADSPVRSILDLGAGTGSGSFGLLGHFPDAHVLAIDASEEMLERLRRRAEQLGLSDRVSTVCADLDTTVPGPGEADLAWASASLHHLADPDRTLGQLTAAIRPGGLVAVIELAGFPRFVPDDTPGGAAESRAHALLAAAQAADMPTMGSDWGPRLTRAGLVVELERTILVDLPLSTPVAAAYAAATLARIREHVADQLDPTDRGSLDELLAGGITDVRRRADLRVSTERRLWIARRPVASRPQA